MFFEYKYIQIIQFIWETRKCTNNTASMLQDLKLALSYISLQFQWHSKIIPKASPDIYNMLLTHNSSTLTEGKAEKF